MKPIEIFNVIPSLPEKLEVLRTLAHNLRWAWSHDSIELFRRLDSELWEATGHNPVLMLGAIDQERLAAVANDDAFLAHMERAALHLQEYLDCRTCWFPRNHKSDDPPLVAYFSAEFGLTECLSIFAGGLGILAGDHLKSASDLGVPLVGVGLLYQQGYFRQYLNQAGWQQEAYEDNDFHNLPVALATRADGSPLSVEVQFPGRRVTAQVWSVNVGRIPLYLLDTNIEVNRPEDRDITDQLYGGDHDMRIRQEILLGIGGYRALEALGFKPTVCHMNEGHSAFLALERARRLMERHHLSFTEARQLASASLVFTTHTPVEAGHDYFSPDLMDYYFGDYARSLGLNRNDFLALGRRNPENPQESFCMTILALRMASYRNGVSKLHGQVSRKMWRSIWPELPEDEIPITCITNGVHGRSWLSHEMNQLYDRYLGPDWREEPGSHTLWRRVESIPTEELWRTHELRRERLVSFTRRRLRMQLERRGAPRAEIEAADEVLDPGALTIGFARRFASYKRASLLFRNKERLAAILNNSAFPVQLIYAGKAHPRDGAGKDLIRQVLELARQKEFRHRLVFLENYDMAISRALVQGADVWLNTPLRPLEASGTSGMKAAVNGALNVSTLDGWWDEAWRGPDAAGGQIGWAIGNGESYDDPEYQHQVESDALYDLLEKDVIPTFYDRGTGRVPRHWIARMKASIGNLCYFFNTHRMVREYTERFYANAHTRYRELAANNAARAAALTSWMARVRQAWPEVHLEVLPDPRPAEVPVGSEIHVRAHVSLGSLTPEDVAVELYAGRLDSRAEIQDARVKRMEVTTRSADGSYIFETAATPQKSGRHGYTVRILPHHPDLAGQLIPGLIVWAVDTGLRPAISAAPA